MSEPGGIWGANKRFGLNMQGFFNKQAPFLSMINKRAGSLIVSGGGRYFGCDSSLSSLSPYRSLPHIITKLRYVLYVCKFLRMHVCILLRPSSALSLSLPEPPASSSSLSLLTPRGVTVLRTISFKFNFRPSATGGLLSTLLSWRLKAGFVGAPLVAGVAPLVGRVVDSSS